MIVKKTRAEIRFILALDRFLQARNQEQKIQAARWVNAWGKHVEAAPLGRSDRFHSAWTSLLDTSDISEV
jgi:hypothetical protein